MKDNSENKLDMMFLQYRQGKVYKTVIDHTEKELIEKALKRSFGNQSIAAKLLGINRNTLRAKIGKLKIDAAMYKI
ncbi:MAG: helix-turn-helix domain-containing protein [Candidatus Omnitrophica bacterium]|nr:helix-turn-helix domain-containing protein [Candidatus Omnitrophota bacterium]MDD5487704.1 helix-turn-helix domain-containing protein [Candidatus Omnitrophota bacterium]